MTLSSMPLSLQKFIGTFFCDFLDNRSAILCKIHFLSPAKNMTHTSMGKLVHQAGLNGCLGSSDGAHVGTQSFPSWERINHKGFKLSLSSRNCSATVTHFHQIMGTDFFHLGT